MSIVAKRTAGLIKTPLGTEVDLDPAHNVLDGDPDPPRKGHISPPLFGPCLLWPRSPISATAELLLELHKLRDLDLNLGSGRGHTGAYIWSRSTHTTNEIEIGKTFRGHTDRQMDTSEFQSNHCLAMT